MDIPTILFHPFTLGLLLGLIFAALAFYQLLRAKGEMKNYRRHLSDKLEIEAESMQKTRRELETLRRESETLRMKISAVNESAAGRSARDLEIYARAEKRMLVTVPGFAPAWEGAKSSAMQELEEEESGRSLPKRVFTRLFGGKLEGDKTGDETGGLQSLPDAAPRDQPRG